MAQSRDSASDDAYDPAAENSASANEETETQEDAIVIDSSDDEARVESEPENEDDGMNEVAEVAEAEAEEDEDDGMGEIEQDEDVELKEVADEQEDTDDPTVPALEVQQPESASALEPGSDYAGQSQTEAPDPDSESSDTLSNTPTQARSPSMAQKAALSDSDQSGDNQEEDEEVQQQQQPEQEAQGGDEDDDEEYEPSAPGLTFDVPSQIVPDSYEPDIMERPTTTRMRAGFVVDGDSDDEEMSQMTAISKSAARLSSFGANPAPNVIALSPTPPSTIVNGQNAAPQTNLPSSVPDTSRSTPAPASEVGQPSGVVADTWGRLPNDLVGIFEDRIKEDPKGDVDAWLGLIREYEGREKIEEAREVYERFLAQFPTAAQQWVSYVKMELQHDHFYHAEKLFDRSLAAVPDFQLWWAYLDYIRRQNNLTTDTTGKARNVVFQAYDVVIQNVGLDAHAGELWKDYIGFLKSGPGVVGGSGWQDQQKTDQIRRAYRRAISVPTDGVCAIWKEYDGFEVGLSRLRGRKFLQEVSAIYMTARTAQLTLADLIAPLDRRTPARLPPLFGFKGYQHYQSQVGLWKKWIGWEMDDPLVLRDDDLPGYQARVLYAFKQALIPLRYWPPLWLDAAEFCYSHKLNQQGDRFLDEGITANPDSSLLAFRKADRVEMTTAPAEGDPESRNAWGDAVRAPYDKLLDTLYDLVAHHNAKEQAEIARVRENFGGGDGTAEGATDGESQPNGATQPPPPPPENSPLAISINSIQTFHRAQVKLLSKAISFAWIALMRAMRRIHGLSGVDRKQHGGFRKVFADARKRGRITSDVYIASALTEHNYMHEQVVTRMFDKGMKLFPDDDKIVLAYLQLLISKHEFANARAEFEKAVARFLEKADTIPKTRPLFQFMHQYESHYGELARVVEIERRMAELFPGETKADLFSKRFSEPEFDPLTVQFILSPAAQTQPPDMPPASGPGMAPRGPGGQQQQQQHHHHQHPQQQYPPHPHQQRPHQGGEFAGGPDLSGPGNSMGQPGPRAHGQSQHLGAPNLSHQQSSSAPGPQSLGPNGSKRTAAELDDGPAGMNGGPGGGGAHGDVGMGMPPRKIPRNEREESPLKGAAGRRLATLRNAAAVANAAAAAAASGPGGAIGAPGGPGAHNNNALGGGGGSILGSGLQGTIPGGVSGSIGATVSAAAEPLPSQVTFLLGIIPHADRYGADMEGPRGWKAGLDPVKLVALVSRLDLASVEARLG